MKAIIVSIILILSAWGTVSACSCLGNGQLTKEEILEAKTIFIGKILKVEFDSEGYYKIAKIRVTENLKGTSEGQIVYLKTPRDSGMCGLHLNKGDKWYIFSDGEDLNSLEVGMCNRHLKLNARLKASRRGREARIANKKAYEKERNRVKGEIEMIKNSL